MFYYIFVALSLIVSSFPVLDHYSSRPTRILHGIVILRIAAHFLLTVFFLVVLSFAWKMKKQTTVFRSSVEAELRAMALLMAMVTMVIGGFWCFCYYTYSPLSNSTCAISIVRDPMS
jgi:hypothetical protein